MVSGQAQEVWSGLTSKIDRRIRLKKYEVVQRDGEIFVAV